ncbi:MAG: type II 3-dehydroquinate dehydratase [Acidimicrobiia bacterium]
MTKPTVLLISGPNLNMLGTREPAIYGTGTLSDHVAAFTAVLEGTAEVDHVQSNHEGELVDAIQHAKGACAAIVVNAAALTHYSWAIHDALAMCDLPVVELHISNPYAREPWRHTSVVAPVATGTICGFGGHGYVLAAMAVKELIR